MQFVILTACRAGLYGYGESEYFLLRNKLMDYGLKPYSDFEFMYGPALLYGFRTFSHIFKIQDNTSLIAITAVETLVGFWAVFYLTRELFPRDKRLFVFGCLLLPSISVFLMGQNYTYFRFAAPITIAYLAYKIFRLRPAFAGFGVVATFLTSWLISPELAITSALALFLVFFVSGSWRERIGIAVLTISGLVLTFSALPILAKSMLTMLVFVGGGNAFPVFPTAHIVILLLGLFVSTRLIASIEWKKNPLVLLLFLYSVFNLPASLGRCDPSHVAFDSFALGLLAAKFLESRPVRLRLWLQGSSIVITLMVMIGTLYYYVPVIGGLLIDSSRENLSEQQKQWIETHSPEKYKTKIQARLKGINRTDDLKRFAGSLLIQPRSDQLESTAQSPYFFSYFASPQAPLSLKANQQLAGEIANASSVVVAVGLIENFCSPWSAHDRVLEMLLWFPVRWFPKRNEPNDLRKSICIEMAKLEKIDEQPGLYVVYKKRGG